MDAKQLEKMMGFAPGELEKAAVLASDYFSQI